MRVTIIGAGVAGLTAALALSERAEVEVLEQGETLGARSCSRFAGGMLAPWCERESAEEAVVTLGQEALAFWPSTVPNVVQNGTLVVAPRRDEPELDRFARRTREYERLDADAIARLEPDLADRFRTALFFPREAHLDPRATLTALGDLLRARGVSIRLGCVADPNTADGERVIDCRGLAARDRVGGLRGVKGEMLIVRTREVSLSRPVRLLHPRIPLYVVPRDDGLFMIGATMIESDDRGRMTARSMVDLLNAAYALHPAFAEAEIVEIGCDARPAFFDNLPRIVDDGRIVSLNGLYRHGFLLSPALARRAAAVVLDHAFFPEVMNEDHRQRRPA